MHIWLYIVLFVTCVSAGLVDDIVNAIKNAATCASCHALLVPLKGLAALGDTPFTASLTAVCTSFGLEPEDVCEGAIGQQGPIIAHDLRAISPLKQTSEKLCGSLLGLCQPPAVNKWTVSFPKAAPKSPKPFVRTGKAPFQVAHFSDIHIDRQYTVGTDASCNKPICCRNFTDHTGPIIEPAGPFGSPHCDTPATLVHSFLDQVSKDNIFSLFTGDVIEAAVWLTTQQEVIDDMRIFNSELQTMLGAPVYPTIGPENSPTNAFPRNTTQQGNSQWVFDTQADGWKAWIQDAGSDQVKHFSGSYSIIPPGTNLRIISINTVYWYKMNFWLYDSDILQADPNGILGFTIQQLQAAEDAGQRVWIVAHMQPGSGDTLWDQSNYFDQIVQRYKNTIAGQFYGHSHKDEFSIAYSDYGNRNKDTATSIAYIAPALTPRSGKPAFKLYDVDPDTYEVVDVRVFYTDYSDPSFQQNPQWELLYSARSTYGPAAGLQANETLSPSFWHRVTDAFAANDTLFQQYRTYTARVDPGSCDASCKANTICALRALRSENNCAVTQPGLNFKRRDVEGNFVEDEDDTCEGKGIGHIFTRLAGWMDEADPVSGFLHLLILT
ncbi:sphingomyelin phosphodiesterase [Pluteus cervinus]|uniref:Sphingomyelin phosphodiesterase n=1 Tax=Pluteus cervinus TaxID=181527 RepID=A0ACD3B605_9AGAR|nr:sphingomyelin phosphodiesterase [Pluteus cervinus]